jgi:hypothetical protein
MSIESCGKQYEAEHPNKIIERHQYRVDSNKRCNHKDALPPPFKICPRLGARLSKHKKILCCTPRRTN